MHAHCLRVVRGILTVLALMLIGAMRVHGLPAPGALRFVAPSPGQGTLVTAASVAVKLDAACTFDGNTLAVSLNGTPIAASVPAVLRMHQRPHAVADGHRR